jgi:hypothetical protein
METEIAEVMEIERYKVYKKLKIVIPVPIY